VSSGLCKLAFALGVMIPGATLTTAVAFGASTSDAAQHLVPLTQLVDRGSAVVFSPKRLDLQAVSSEGCQQQPAPRQFELVNRTSTNQVVEYEGSEVVKLAPGQKASECLFTSPGTYMLTLKSSSLATLTLVVGG
jgi:hypothetical protein